MKIICIGRNYAEHASEMNEKVPEEPFFFLKPDSAILQKNTPFFYPDFSNNIQFETELVVKIDRLGKNIQQKFAHKYYSEVALGIDFTARDLQQKAKERSLPWTLSKGFDGSAVLSPFVPLEKLSNPIQNLHFHLLKNGEKVQQACTSEMLFKVDEFIAYVSQYMTLKIGDFIYTGTPSGVGSVAIGDRLEGFLENSKMFDFYIK